MRVKALTALMLAGFIAVGCSAAQLKARKDNAWSNFPQALPDTQQANPGGYGHPLRGLAFVVHPIGVALDYALVRPFYLLGGLAPEWFGLTPEDAQRYQSTLPELVTPQNVPQRLQ